MTVVLALRATVQELPTVVVQPVQETKLYPLSVAAAVRTTVIPAL